MDTPRTTLDRAREALARDEARARAQRRGTLVILGGALIAAIAWVALANGILVLATAAGPLAGTALVAFGIVAIACATFVIIVGIRMRRRAWGHSQPGSDLGKPDGKYQEVPSTYALPAPYLNHGGGSNGVV
ncbi:MAG TPA: hypothetical protein VN045_08450 [Microbacteriaceae bacterium]|jgi:hypothetical protein|nr:hypothetical protein [Microbacteriaceae bacterium]